MEKYKKSQCRYCDHQLDQAFLELGSMPLANSFLSKDQAGEVEFECPLSLTRCTQCGLVQLTHVVPAEKMFTNYLYVSSTTSTFKKHFAEYAKDVKARSLRKDNLVAVDIGSNDGLLVSCFIKEGMNGVGVEPASNLAEEADRNNIPTINRYFDKETVAQIIQKHGKADIITANNVFAHIDDSRAVCKNAGDLLADDGMFVLEFPYLITMVENMLFDMIYHEHLSYICLTSLNYLLGGQKMEIFDVQEVASHGGSLRVYIQKSGGHHPVQEKVSDLIGYELAGSYDMPEVYDAFAKKVYKVREELQKFVRETLKLGKRISGYGAPAKGNTLINFCNFNASQIEYIVDDNPLKQNMLSPGARIPVVPGSHLEETPTDYVLIFAWNFAKEIIKKIEHLRSRNVKFVIPLPALEIV